MIEFIYFFTDHHKKGCVNKKKIFNDPVYGFITVHSELIFDIIESTYFQRLRRIKQLGLSDLVYPGALHTRFHHALGAMHLMGTSLENLRSKDVEISDVEYESALIAILLHDIGHGPFSHTLEHRLLNNINHEHISLMIMERLNIEFNGALDLALQIFQGKYSRSFFNDLVSSQLDIDRLDYLKRDSFFTGVSEGSIGAERIIKLLNVKDDHIVVEEKGIYSIESFLNARRLMYWQVYLHKTALSADQMLNNMVARAQELAQLGENVPSTEALSKFLNNRVDKTLLEGNEEFLDSFLLLDDHDIWSAIKAWSSHTDPALSALAKWILERNLFAIKIFNSGIDEGMQEASENAFLKTYPELAGQKSLFVTSGEISNSAYIAGGVGINILTKSGELQEISKMTDLPNIKAMSNIVTKYYLCWPKGLLLQPFTSN